MECQRVNLFLWKILEKKLSKLIITEIDYKGKNKIFCGLHDSERFYQVNFSDLNEGKYHVGDVFVGRVKDIVKNINAAFIEFQKGCVGYFSLEENKNIEFLNNKNTTKLCEGDYIIVQLEKAAVKTKFPVLTSNISLSGRNLVLNIGKKGIGYSGKINDVDFKEKISCEIERFMSEKASGDSIYENVGLIVRTNAANESAENILEELDDLLNEWVRIKRNAVTRSCYSILKKSDSTYLDYVKGSYSDEISEIITDKIDVFQDIQNYMVSKQIGNENCVRLYEDELLPLSKLYSIDKLIDGLLNRKVWLKSGAYLVIEPTEAMVVVDVNTGKNIKGKDVEETILGVNKEAAKEIAYQLRIRNLSGIILMDFINMRNEKNRKELLDYLKYCVKEDRVKTVVVDMTKLELVEVTRKKIEPPVYEQLM